MTDLYNRSLPFSQDRYRQDTERRVVICVGKKVFYTARPE